MRPVRALGRHRIAAALFSTLLVATVLPIPAAAPASAAPHAARTDTVSMSVKSMTPVVPKATLALEPLTVELQLTNTTQRDIKDVRIIAERGDPIGTQSALDASLAATDPPPSSGLPIRATHPVTIDLPAGGQPTVTFSTTTSTSIEAGLCICHEHLVYPLYFSAHVTVDGVDQRLGVTSAYLPAFDVKPAPVQVSWVWPLLERPHRLFGGTAFSDDLLAGVVSDDGRLFRALEVVERLPATIPLTVVIDPELLDELQVMATLPYTVTERGRSVPGTGKQAAAEWLNRLRAAFAAHPDVHVAMTPYADPDVEALATRGLPWVSTLPDDMAARVSAALDGHSPDPTLAWPVGGALSRSTLPKLVGLGVRTLILNSAAVRPATPEGGVPAGLARLDADGTDIAVALTSAAMQKYAARAVTLGATEITTLPQLVAEIAIRSAQEADIEHAVTITAPRYVDASVEHAVEAIEQTSRSSFAAPIALSSAVSGTLLPTGRSRLPVVASSSVTLPPEILDTADRLDDVLPSITAMLDPKDPAAQTLLAGLPVAMQRAESSASADATAGGTGLDYARQLRERLDVVTNGVHIVRPSSGAYTLASNTSPIPITVDNELPYPVTIKIRVRTVVNGLPGFSTEDIGVKRVDSNQKRTLNIPTRTERSGRIQVNAELLTPNNIPLGPSVLLTVRSTALGVIGVVITIVAGAVLALALLLRVLRRLRARRNRAPLVGAPA